MATLEERKRQDAIVYAKLNIVPLRFTSGGCEMMYVYPDTDHELAGWILARHFDGQWITYRKATADDVLAIIQAISREFHL